MTDTWHVRANMTQGDIALGGELVVESGRIRFEPNGFDRGVGGQGGEWELQEISSVDRAPRTWGLFDGGLRRRLRLRFADGGEALFVVTKTADTARRIVDSARAVGGSAVLEL